MSTEEKDADLRVEVIDEVDEEEFAKDWLSDMSAGLCDQTHVCKLTCKVKHSDIPEHED